MLRNATIKRIFTTFFSFFFLLFQSDLWPKSRFTFTLSLLRLFFSFFTCTSLYKLKKVSPGLLMGHCITVLPSILLLVLVRANALLYSSHTA